MRVPTEKQVNAVGNLLEQVRNGETLNKGKALMDAGYSEEFAAQPSRVFGSPTIIALMDKMGMAENDLHEVHKSLLNAHRLDHMTFPLGPDEDLEGDMADEDDDDMGEDVLGDDEEARSRANVNRTKLTDQEIREMLGELGCNVRRIVHGQQARHVYFWSPDNTTRQKALDMAYNIRGSYAPKRVEGKHDVRVGVFSMKELRKKMQKRGIDVVEKKP
jgi:hypothetical protein